MPLSTLTQSRFPVEPDFDNPETRIKIHPGTSIAFDDSDHVVLSHPNSPEGQAIRVQSDILLILWDLVYWKSMGALLQEWPDPVDYPKIKAYIKQFYECNLLITEGGEANPSVGTVLPLSSDTPLPTASPAAVAKLDALVEHQHFNLHNHTFMLKDDRRVLAFKQAIDRAVAKKKESKETQNKETFVLDVGSGTGILSFLAHQAGAASVVGVERREDMVSLAQLIARYNQMDAVRFLAEDSHHVDPNCLTPQPNLLIAELLGDGGVDEHILEFVLDARDRLLADGATLMPYRIALYVFGFEARATSDYEVDVEHYREIYGVDLMPLAEVVKRKPLRVRHARYNPDADKCLAKPVQVVDLDLYTLKEPSIDVQVNLPVQESGEFSGYGVYFKAWLDEETVLTNDPWAEKGHWAHVLYSLSEPQSVRAGDVISLQVTYDGQLNVRF